MSEISEMRAAFEARIAARPPMTRAECDAAICLLGGLAAVEAQPDFAPARRRLAADLARYEAVAERASAVTPDKSTLSVEQNPRE